MKRFIIYILGILFILPMNAKNEYNLIPYPSQLTEKEGIFTFTKGMAIALPDNKDYAGILSDFANELNRVSNLNIKTANSKIGAITFIINDKIAEEAYKLSVNKKNIHIEASTPAGLFYALGTLRQLLPVEIFGKEKVDISWTAPCVEIEDAPRFPYRGAHLDVCRHFMPKEFVLKYIDLLATYKMNRFHFHLTDDQGWRIEIKKYPKLTEIGATRSGSLIGHKSVTPQVFDSIEHKGYFTQEDIKDIVAYAQKRYITVIPEIELPGHASAAVAAYPELACGVKDKYEVIKGWGVFEDIFCPKESTFTFLENVLAEVIELFPSHYIHIGGDECPKVAWKACSHCQNLIKEKGLKDETELQSYFTHRMEEFVNSKGRDIIGWDEILEGGLAPNATVMSWRGDEGGIAAAKMKHNVIMAPHKFCYLDYYQEPRENAPLTIGGDLPLQKVYSLNPVPDVLSDDEKKYIIGVQSTSWTEYMLTPKHVEYMVFPRLTAMAEVAWTPVDKKDWDSYYKRVQTEFKRLDMMDVNACQYERVKP